MPHDKESSSSSDKKGLLYNIIGGILIAGCCWSLGYGYSQSTLGQTVAKASLTMEHMKETQLSDRKAFEESDARLSKDLADMRTMNSEHMKSVVSLVETMTRQNQELIAFLRAQANARQP